MESREFYFELCKLLNSLNNSYDKYAKRNGIVSNNLLWLVYALSDGKEHTQLEMCNHTSLPKTTVNTLIKDLENNQYVTLKKGIDKRERLVSLTEKGKTYANNLCSALPSAFPRLLVGRCPDGGAHGRAGPCPMPCGALRSASAYFAASTRVLSAKYNSAFRKASVRPARQFAPSGV